MLNEDIENITTMLKDAAAINAGVVMKIHNRLVSVGAEELLAVFQRARLRRDAEAAHPSRKPF